MYQKDMFWNQVHHFETPISFRKCLSPPIPIRISTNMSWLYLILTYVNIYNAEAIFTKRKKSSYSSLPGILCFHLPEMHTLVHIDIYACLHGVERARSFVRYWQNKIKQRKLKIPLNSYGGVYTFLHHTACFYNGGRISTALLRGTA